MSLQCVFAMGFILSIHMSLYHFHLEPRENAWGMSTSLREIAQNSTHPSFSFFSSLDGTLLLGLANEIALHNERVKHYSPTFTLVTVIRSEHRVCRVAIFHFSSFFLSELSLTLSNSHAISPPSNLFIFAQSFSSFVALVSKNSISGQWKLEP